MRKINTTEELHTILLDLGKQFHNICVKYDIPYYMLGGTMLGAVRHNGFIPWDDDMDFGIPRDKYDEFLICAKKELPENYKILTATNSNYAILGIGKLSNENTILSEICSIDTNERLGINIDIFPLDYTDSNISCFSTNWIVRKAFKLQKLLFMETGFRPWHKKTLAFIAKAFIRVKRNTIPNIIHKHMLQRNCTVEMVANLYGAWAMREVIPIHVFGEPQLYKFEDTKFYGVSDYDTYLKRIYNNYMELPPENKRHIHALNAYYK